MGDRPSARASIAAALAAVVAGGAAAPAPAAPRRDADRFLDVRLALPTPTTAKKASARAAATRKRLGGRAVLAVDRLTGTVRSLQRLDGALTGPSAEAPAAVARRYARAHATDLGLDRADVDAMRVADQLRSPSGLTVVRLGQAVDGVPAFDNDLRVGIDHAGRVLTVGGSPRADLGPAIDTTPKLSAAQALDALMTDTGVRRTVTVTRTSTNPRRTTTFSTGDVAQLVLFGARDVHLAWHLTYDAGGTHWFDAVVDATTGEVLYRANLVKSVTSDVYHNYPGASVLQGNTRTPETLDPYLASPTVQTLTGPNVHAWADVNDDNAASASEEVVPGNYTYNTTSSPAPTCTPAYLCTWTPGTASSWQNNMNQNVVQTFWYANHFHDHLLAPPIGFTPASHNFQGDDPLELNALDGAATGPDANHINNSNMAVPADGQSPRMQMYLFRAPLRNVNGGDDAAVLYHEYTHGLSSRLVTNADGTQALNAPQAGAMGEGWSDWYAMDLLVREGLVTDTPGVDGDVDLGRYVDLTQRIRQQAMDCAVGSTNTTACPTSANAGTGGYTYGDFARIAGSAEVHADGEIWGQTLWQLRQALVARLGSDIAGSDVAERIITDAMRLSIPEPSFLDVRNAMVAAETNAFGGAYRSLLWDVFRQRGMGFYAGTADSSDVHVVEDGSAPPPPGAPTGTIEGHIVSGDSGLPLAAATAGIGGLSTSPGLGTYLAASTDDAGHYAIGGVPQGTYPKLVLAAPGGYDRAEQRVTVDGGQTATADAVLQRDWAAGAGGGRATANDTTGAPFGCGPAAVIDQSLGAGWSSENHIADPDPSNRYLPTVTIQLPAPLAVERFGMDPANTCGDPSSAATKGYRVETSADGSTWTTAAQGEFGLSQRGRLNDVVPTAGTSGVRFVRLTLLSPQGSTSDFIDFSELAVYGRPPNVLPSGTLTLSATTAAPGDTVTFDASSFRDPDSAITGYDWDFDGDGGVDQTTAGPTTSYVYGAAGAFAPRVLVRDYRGGAGTAQATIQVGTTPFPNPKPRVKARPAFVLPRTGTKGRVRFKVKCPDACRLRATLTIDAATKRRARTRFRTVARLGPRTIHGTRTVTITISRRSRASLRRARVTRPRVTLRATATVTGGGGPSRTVSRRIKLRLS